MKTIFYGLNGEGLGHASRTLAVLDYLSDYNVHVFTYGKAYDYLINKVKNLHKINGVMFSYKDNAVNYFGTVKNVSDFVFSHLGENKRFLLDMTKEHHPDLFITDFEPSLPRVAKIAGVPVISVDNQHRFAYYDLVATPLWMKIYGFLCGLVAKVMVPKPHRVVISTFHHKLLFPKKFNVTVTNGLIRKSLEEAVTTTRDHVLVYLRDSISDVVLKSISKIHANFRIYGAKDTTVKSQLSLKKNIQFCPLGQGFVEDLVSCRALITSAGNQLITEARYCKKPCLVIPEPKQYEQYINAFYVDYLGFGQWYDAKQLNKRIVKDFLFEFKGKFEDVRNGVHDVIKIIKNIN